MGKNWCFKKNGSFFQAPALSFPALHWKIFPVPPQQCLSFQVAAGHKLRIRSEDPRHWGPGVFWSTFDRKRFQRRVWFDQRSIASKNTKRRESFLKQTNCSKDIFPKALFIFKKLGIFIIWKRWVVRRLFFLKPFLVFFDGMSMWNFGVVVFRMNLSGDGANIDRHMLSSTHLHAQTYDLPWELQRYEQVALRADRYVVTYLSDKLG